MADYIDFEVFKMFVARFRILKERLKEEKLDDDKFKRFTDLSNEIWVTINEFMNHYKDKGIIDSYLKFKSIINKELHEFI